MSRWNDAGSAPAAAYFGGFAWPVPRAFEAAVAQARFELGDVLYPTHDGFGPAEGKLSRGLWALQILAPQRSARTSGTDGAGDRRRSAWDGEVSVERVDLASGKTEVLELTQGKLIMALWKGDESWLDSDRSAPEPPRGARELQQALGQASPAFAARGLPSAGTRGCRFLFVLDEASASSRSKALAIEGALRAKGDVEALSLTPAVAGLEDGDSYHPALLVQALFLARRSEKVAHDALRAVLYGGGSSPDADSEDAKGSSDRFSLARHGLLESF